MGWAVGSGVGAVGVVGAVGTRAKGVAKGRVAGTAAARATAAQKVDATVAVAQKAVALKEAEMATGTRRTGPASTQLCGHEAVCTAVQSVQAAETLPSSRSLCEREC